MWKKSCHKRELLILNPSLYCSSSDISDLAKMYPCWVTKRSFWNHTFESDFLWPLNIIHFNYLDSIKILNLFLQP